MRVLATQINPANYLCINDNHSLYGITANNISGLPTQEVGNIALESAYEPLMRQGGNFEADISQYWSALQTQYPSLTSAEQTEMGYKLLKRVWLWGSWAHIADRSGDIRRALAFTSRSYFDLGTLTAPQLGPLQSLVQGVIPTQPFGPAIYYSQSAMKAAETYFAQTVGTNNNLFSYANEFDSLLAYIDGAGGPVGYYVSDAALDKIKAGSAAAPSAWIILQDTYNRDALQDIPSAELNELKGIAPVLDVYVAKSGGYNLNAGTDAVAQLAALSNQPLIFTTTGGPSPISAACASAGYPTYLIKNTALTGFGFYDQSNRLIVVTSNPSRCPDAVALSGTINLQNVTFAGKLANGPYTLTDLFANQSMTINIVEGKVTIPVDVARWDSLAYAIAPAQ